MYFILRHILFLQRQTTNEYEGMNKVAELCQRSFDFFEKRVYLCELNWTWVAWEEITLDRFEKLKFCHLLVNK